MKSPAQNARSTVADDAETAANLYLIWLNQEES